MKYPLQNFEDSTLLVHTVLLGLKTGISLLDIFHPGLSDGSEGWGWVWGVGGSAASTCGGMMFYKLMGRNYSYSYGFQF